MKCIKSIAYIHPLKRKICSIERFIHPFVDINVRYDIGEFIEEECKNNLFILQLSLKGLLGDMFDTKFSFEYI